MADDRSKWVRCFGRFAATTPAQEQPAWRRSAQTAPPRAIITICGPYLMNYVDFDLGSTT